MTNIRYIYPRGHRPLVLDPDDLTEQKVLHSRARPEGCVAYRIVEIPGAQDTVAVHWAYSVWNPNDKIFRKSKARVLAKDRMLEDPCITFCPKTMRPSEMISDVLRDISQSKLHQWSGQDDVLNNDKVVFVNNPLSNAFRRTCKVTEQRMRATLKEKKTTEEKAA